MISYEALLARVTQVRADDREALEAFRKALAERLAGKVPARNKEV